jgi:hypothetical protein
LIDICLTVKRHCEKLEARSRMSDRRDPDLLPISPVMRLDNGARNPCALDEDDSENERDWDSSEFSSSCRAFTNEWSRFPAASANVGLSQSEWTARSRSTA